MKRDREAISVPTRWSTKRKWNSVCLRTVLHIINSTPLHNSNPIPAQRREVCRSSTFRDSPCRTSRCVAASREVSSFPIRTPPAKTGVRNGAYCGSEGQQCGHLFDQRHPDTLPGMYRGSVSGYSGQLGMLKPAVDRVDPFSSVTTRWQCGSLINSIVRWPAWTTQTLGLLGWPKKEIRCCTSLSVNCQMPQGGW